jgi:hypothetical protein
MTKHMDRPHAYKKQKDYQRAQWLKRYKVKRMKGIKDLDT